MGIDWNSPPPAGITEQGMKDMPIDPAQYTKKPTLKSAGEKMYEQGVQSVRKYLAEHLDWPVSWPYLGYGIGKAIPPTIPEASTLATSAVFPEVMPELSVEERAITTPGKRLLYSALSRGVPPAIVGGVTAAETGLPVAPNAAAGFATGMTGKVSDIIGEKLASRRLSPYVVREQRAGTARAGGTMQQYFPNLFNQGPLNKGEHFLNAFSGTIEDFDYVKNIRQRQSIINRRTKVGKQQWQRLENQITYLRKPYMKLQEFFGDPDSFTAGPNPSIDFSKFKKWLIDNRRDFADAKITVNMLGDMIRGVYGLAPNEDPTFLGVDIEAEGGRIAGRLHSFLQHGGGSFLPFNPGLHGSFGKSGQFVGNYPQLAPSMTRRIALQEAINRLASSLANPDEEGGTPTTENTFPPGP